MDSYLELKEILLSVVVETARMVLLSISNLMSSDGKSVIQTP